MPQFAALALLMAAAALADDAPKPNAKPPAGPTTTEELWADLAKEELPAARALLKLAERRDDLVPLLRKRLKPLTIDAKRVRELVADLGAADDAVALEAFEALDYLDPRLAIDLDELMEEVQAEPARPRLVRLLSRSHGVADPLKDMKALDGKKVKYEPFGDGDGANFRGDGAWWAERKVERLAAAHAWHGNCKPKWARAVRAIVLLEHLGTPDALDLLGELAGGHPDAAPTKAAKEAAERLAKKK